MAFRKIEAGLVQSSVDNFIGKRGTLFYDVSDGALRISDGTTPGGSLISSGGSGYTLPTATSTTKGGVKIGSNITITDGVISVAAPFSGSYNDLTNKPTIPSLTGYATESYVTSQGYITSTDTVIKVAGSFASNSAFKSEVVADLSTGVRISTWWGLPAFATEARWQFDYDGILTFPDGTEQITAWTGTSTALQWTAAEFFPNATATATVTAGDGAVDINLVTGIPGSSTSVNWSFTNQGTIVFPDDTTQYSAYTGDSSTTEALTIGTGLSGTSFNGSTPVTIALDDNYGDTKNPYASKTAKYFLAAPNAANGAPTFRAIVASDIPTLNQNTTGSAAKLTTARNINSVAFDGTADITVTAAAGTLTGTELKSTVVTSSLTSVGTLTGLTVQSGSGINYVARFKGSTGGDQFAIGVSSTAGYGAGNDVLNSAGTAYAPYTLSASTMTFKTGSSVPATAFSINSSGTVTFNNTVTGSINGNAGTVTNGVYTTDTGTVTNTMLSGSIANNKLANSGITVNGTSISLGSSATVTAAAGTLTGNTLASGVTTSSLTSVGTLAGLRTTGHNNFGSNTFTKVGYDTGDITLDNGSTDTPGLLMYYANNTNFALDSWNGQFSVLSGQLLRFVYNLNESGGAVKAAIDTTGNLATAGFVQPGSYRAGQVIKDTMLNNSEFTVNNTTVATTTSDTTLLTYSYTPDSSSSYLIIHVHVADYRAASDTGGAGTDSYFSRIKVDDAEIVYSRQMTRSGEGFRTGSLFPLTGRYTNSNTTAKTITVAVRRDSADDSITVTNSSTALTLRITEIAR